MKLHYVYKITNNINRRFYVGVRTFNGIVQTDPYMGSGKIIRLAIKKQGIQNFSKQILGIFHDKSLAYAYQKIIVNQQFVDNPMTYNIKIGGVGGSTNNGIPHSEQTKCKIADANRRRVWTDQSRLKMSQSKKNISDETRAKIKAARAKQVITQQTKKKMGESRKGNKNALGSKWTQQRRNKHKEFMINYHKSIKE